MPNEVWAKLGVDTASVPADMEKAKAAFSKGAADIEKAAGAHGDGAGGKLVGSLEHRLLGARHLSGALATALGLNIENIAEHITSVLVGGSKEAWKQMGEIADENSKLIEKRIELAMTPKGLQEKIKKDAARAAAELQGAGKDDKGEAIGAVIDAQLPGASKLAELFGFIKSDAERQVEAGQAALKSGEAEVRVAEQEKAVKESHKKLDEYRAADAAKHLNSTEKLAALEKEIDDTLSKIAVGGLSLVEIDQQRMHLIDLQGQIQDENDARTQREIDKKKELLRLQANYIEAQRKLAKDEEELQNKRADRGKLTLAEIAELKPGKTGVQFGESSHVDTFGLSEEQAKAKQTAVDIQRMQKQAESLRTSGDVTGANTLFDQIGKKKQTLVDSGFAKSTEGDNFKQLEETIHKDNMDVQKIIQEIADTAKGKLRNE